jgi:SAM-dependent methyltransferase
MGKFYPADYGPHRKIRGKRRSKKYVFKNKALRRPFLASVCGDFTRESRLLDVGCGSGDFLNDVRALTSCQVYGIDLSPRAARAAEENYGLEALTGTIMESPFPDKYFDLITAWEYLEHVHSPSEVLLKMSQLLKDEGSCIISTPNFNSFNSKLFKEKWYHLDCPRHLFLYSPDTVSKLLDKAGLTVTGIAFDKTAGGLLRSLQYRFGDDNIPFRQRRRLRGSSLIKKSLLPLTTLLASIKQSDKMIVCARKAKNA